MQIAVLGPLEVRDRASVLEIAGTRLRSLLVRLAISAPNPVSPAALVDAVWAGQPPADPANALQSLVSRLRRTLKDADLVQQVPAGYRLAIGGDDLDLARFERLARLGREQLRAGRYPDAAATLAAGLSLWRGAGSAGSEDLDPAIDAAMVARLQEQRLDAITDRIEADLGLGRFSDVVGELEQLVAAYPLQEQLSLLLMRAQYGAGRIPQALAAYERTRRVLVDELGIDPSPQLQAAHLAVLRGEAAELWPTLEPTETVANTAPDSSEPDAHRSNLKSQLTSFVGRDEDVQRIGKLLTEGRLVSLVGPGGAGKTRLAAESVGCLLQVFPDGIWLAELAPVSDPSDVPQTVLAALGLRDSTLIDRSTATGARDATAKLMDAIAERSCILVLDNCEHLIEAAALLTDQLLAQCPQLRVLTTSREPLGVYGEVLVVVPPLGQPAADADPQQAMEYPAARLFIDRAAAVRPDFVIDANTVGSVVEIVRRLDGLPLAIELAAARLRSMPVEQIAARLNDRFRLLTGGSRTALPRHRTLQAVVEWSWDLLTEDERRLARRLAVFVGGVTVASAGSVCVSDELPQSLIEDLLISLVDKSLLQLAPAQNRYRMLETLREFGLERMAEVGEVASIRTAHAQHFAAVVAEADPQLRTREQLSWMATLDAERDNIVAALRYLADDGQPQAALDVALSMAWYWVLVGRHSDAATWTSFALAAPGEIDARSRLVGEALVSINSTAEASNLVPNQVVSDLPTMADLNARLDAYENDIDLHPMIRVLRPVIAMMVQDDERAERLIELGLASEDPWTVASLRAFRAAMAENRGNLQAMRADADIALAEFRRLGERWGMGNCLQLLAPADTASGDLDRAVAEYNEALALFGELGALEDESFIRLRLADVFARQGNLDGARAEIELVVRRSESPDRVESLFAGSGESVFAQILLADIERVMGSMPRALALRDEALIRLARVPEPHPALGHARSVAYAVAAKFDVALGDTEAARERLAIAYEVGIGTRDMPIIAAIGVSVAMFAVHLGRFHDAAEVLGAAARLRGADDATALDIRALNVELLAALGAERLAKAYDSGRAVDTQEAIVRVNPALLAD